MKTYVITVSTIFPKYHKRAGEQTHFVEKIGAINCDLPFPPLEPKIHTVRANYDFWKKRIDAIQKGEAKLSIRYWSGKPYRSKQIVCEELYGVGIQKLENPDNFVFAKIDGKMINWDEIAKNDGLSFGDFCEWFKVRPSEPMAIIHFTDFRY